MRVVGVEYGIVRDFRYVRKWKSSFKNAWMYKYSLAIKSEKGLVSGQFDHSLSHIDAFPFTLGDRVEYIYDYGKCKLKPIF